MLAWPETIETLNAGAVVLAQSAFEQRITVLNTNEKNNVEMVCLYVINFF